MLVFYLLIGFFFSAFFSACEATFLSLDKIQKNKIKREKSFISKIKLKIIDEFNYFIIIILVGNIFFNVLATISANTLFFAYLGENIKSLGEYFAFSEALFEIIFVILFTGCVLILSELLPKLFAVRYNFWLTNIFAPFLYFGYIVFYPLIFLLRLIAHQVISTYGRKKIKKKIILGKREMIAFISRGRQIGSLKKIESLLMETTINYINTSIKAFLITREEVEGIDLAKYKKKNLLPIIKKFPHKNIPVYKKLKDNLLGVIDKKKLAYSSPLTITAKNIDRYLTKPRVISENKNVLEVLNEILNSSSNIAVIVDEYGGMEGIVNKNDLINKVIKKKENEENNGQQIKKIDDYRYYVKANILISDINEKFKTDLKCENAETIGGYLLENIQQIPTRNYVYQDKYFTYTIKSSFSHKINSLILKVH